MLKKVCLFLLLLFLGFCVYVALPSPPSPGTGAVSVVSPPPAPPDPDLPAKVNFNGTQFAITNQGKVPWTNTKATVNSGFTQQIGTVAPGRKVTVGAMTFATSDGTRFNPFQMKPQKFVLTATMNGKTAIYVGGWQ